MAQQIVNSYTEWDPFEEVKSYFRQGVGWLHAPWHHLTDELFSADHQFDLGGYAVIGREGDSQALPDDSGRGGLIWQIITM